MQDNTFEQESFRLLLVIVSVAFLWVIFPLFGAILWAVTFAILFDPLNRALKHRFGRGHTWTALATTLLVLLVVILPAVITSGLVAQEATALVHKLRSGEIDLSAYYRRMVGALPGWAASLLEGWGLKDLPAVQEKLRQSAAEGSQPITRHLWIVGQSTLDFSVNFLVMLYLLFFLLLDGEGLMHSIHRAVPLGAQVQQRLYRNFVTVVRSTVKGNVIVAAIQGVLGGLALMVLGIPGALLWGVVMAVLSLLPAVGAALVWGPIAIYLFANGELVRGLSLLAFGTLVIGLVDNLLRPMLVSKQTRMPDYVVLTSTIGGMTLFGANGFVVGPVLAALFIAAWDISATRNGRADT
jgi:predicted PurR-regulated permease PerM